MTIHSKIFSIVFLLLISCLIIPAQDELIWIDELTYQIYPEVNDAPPNLPSPFLSNKGLEYIIAVTKQDKYAIVPVTLNNELNMCKQLIVDTTDFPNLAISGLHNELELINTLFITERSIEEITKLGRPNGLSQAGFMAEDETILSVLIGDNRLVQKLDLIHSQLAKPLFHIINLMETDLKLNRWNFAKHRWENIKYVLYNDRKVFVEAEDTKGGQKSIFNDGIEGAFYIKIWREPTIDEQNFLKEKYGHLSSSEFEELIRSLSSLNTGEMQPQYVMRYGFYEGHTFWRVDPIAISFIFGLKNLTEIDKAFDGRLYEKLTQHFIESQ